jgi:hypothetical protein
MSIIFRKPYNQKVSDLRKCGRADKGNTPGTKF